MPSLPTPEQFSTTDKKVEYFQDIKWRFGYGLPPVYMMSDGDPALFTVAAIALVGGLTFIRNAVYPREKKYLDALRAYNQRQRDLGSQPNPRRYNHRKESDDDDDFRYGPDSFGSPGM